MAFVDKLSNQQINNLNLLLDTFINAGINNPNFLTAISTLVYKESGIIPQSEKDYSTTANSRIRAVFSSYPAITKMSDTDLTKLKKNPEAFFNLLYGGRYGNSPTEGYKYRGRGYNGHTFKKSYIDLSNKFGIDYVNNPDLINKPENAARGTLWYFTDNNKYFKPNEVTDLTDALKKVYRHNAGWGSGYPTTSRAGYKLMLDSSPEFNGYVLEYLKKKSVPSVESEPQNIVVDVPKETISKKIFQPLLLLVLLGGLYFFVNKRQKQTRAS